MRNDIEKEKFEEGTVQQYFRFQIDKEIPLSDICPLIKEDKKKQVFESKIFNCAEADFLDDSDDESSMERNLYLMEEEEDICS